MNAPEPAAEMQRCFDLLEQRIALLASLADALTAARADIVALDITALENRIGEQDRLCSQIRSVDADLDRMQSRCAAYLGISSAPSLALPNTADARLRDTLSRLHQVQSTVKRLNDAHQMLLRRSRRTAAALLGSYQSFAQLYSDPAKKSAMVGERV